MISYLGNIYGIKFINVRQQNKWYPPKVLRNLNAVTNLNHVLNMGK